MANNKRPKALQREDAGAPAVGGDRKSVLARAKERAKARPGGGDRPGDMENTPRFDQLQADPRMQAAPGAGNPPPSALSKGTAQALEAMAQANKDRPAQAEPEEPEEEPEDLEVEDLVEILRCDARTARRIYEVLYPERDSGGLTKQRKIIEKRVGPLDIGEFLMNGVVSQRVPIIPASEATKGLEVVYSTVTDGVEAHVDRLVADEAARIRHVRLDGTEKVIDANMTEREFVRRQNEYAAVVHIRSYMGQAWPSLTNAQGLVDEAAVQQRLAKVRQIPSPVFVMVINNLSWFLERVQETLDVAVLGNG